MPNLGRLATSRISSLLACRRRQAPSSANSTHRTASLHVRAGVIPAAAWQELSPSRENKPPESLLKQSLPYRKPVPPGGPPAQLSAGGIATRPTPSPLTIPPGPDFHANAKQPDNHSLMSSQSARSQFSDMKSPPTATSAKAPSATSQAAYDDFGRRCEHMKGIFRLQAEFEKSLSSYTPTQWLRAAAWWFVRGRAGMESIIRSRPRSADGQTPGSSHTQLLTQPHVDLAKSWWILAEVIPAHHSLPPTSESLYGERAAAAAAANDGTLTEFFDGCDILNSSLKALLSSMNRNHVMPPHSALIQGQDQTIWVQYPSFAPDILPILSGGKRSLTESAAVRIFDPLSLMAIGDTKKDFSYYRWFVNATISADDQADQISFQCLFSVMRARNDWHPKVGICSQKELVSLCITGERKYGPSWEDVKWSELDSSLQVKLPHGYILNAQLAEPDYHLLVSMYKKAFTVQTSLFPRDDERLLFEAPLETFQYTDNMRPPAFPLERMRRCRVRLFGISEQRAEGRGTRRFYRGLRILVRHQSEKQAASGRQPRNRPSAPHSHRNAHGECRERKLPGHEHVHHRGQTAVQPFHGLRPIAGSPDAVQRLERVGSRQQRDAVRVVETQETKHRARSGNGGALQSGAEPARKGAVAGGRRLEQRPHESGRRLWRNGALRSSEGRGPGCGRNGDRQDQPRQVWPRAKGNAN